MRSVLALLAMILACQPGAARDLRSTWIAPDKLALERVLPPPPVPGSAEAQADLEAVKSAVAARTPQDEQRIEANLPCTLDQFTAALGPDFTTARMPKTAALIEHVFEDGELAVIAAKAAIGRRRPYTLDPDLRTYGHRSDSTAYPSGHSTFGHLAATVLAQIAPDKREALFVRAEAYGRNRFVAGTHFLSDLEAGKIAAAVIAQALFRDAGFRAALDEARAEAQVQALIPFPSE